MTANAINAMRLQEEKRHNRETEGEAQKSRKFDLIGNILGATLRGLGTGVFGSVMSKMGKVKSISDTVKANKSKSNKTNKKGD